MRRFGFALVLFAFLLPVSGGLSSVDADDPGLIPAVLDEIIDGQVHCETDGTEGRRIVGVYLYPPGTANNYSIHADPIRKTLAKIDEVWDLAADPFDQHPRWSCYTDTRFPRIQIVKGPAIGSDGVYTFSDVTHALARAGFADPDRIYLIFADHMDAAYPYNGQATVDDDDRYSQANANNIGPAYAMIDAAARDWKWSHMWHGAMHELGHALGAVQCSAPHSTCPGGESNHHHCWDEVDIMCYEDGGSYGRGRDGIAGTSDDRRMRIDCDAGSPESAQWDCGKDDYFNIAPASGSYLATHWNLRNSRFVTPPREE